MSSPIKIIFGSAAPWSFLPLEKAGEFLPVLEKHNVKDIDTAHIYVRWNTSDIDLFIFAC